MRNTKGDEFPETSGQSQPLSHSGLGKVYREREEGTELYLEGAKKLQI